MARGAQCLAIDSALTASTERQAYHALTPLYLDAWHVTDTSSELNGYECRTDSAERPNQTATFSAPFAELDSLGQFPTGAGTFGLLRPGLINSSFWGEAPGGRPRTTYDTNQTGSYSGVPNTDLLRPMFRPTSNHPQMGAVDFPSLLAYGYNAYGELWQPNTVSKFNALNGTGFCRCRLNPAKRRVRWSARATAAATTRRRPGRRRSRRLRHDGRPLSIATCTATSVSDRTRLARVRIVAAVVLRKVCELVASSTTFSEISR